MARKRQNSSIVSVADEDETLDLQDISEDSVLDSENDSINYI